MPPPRPIRPALPAGLLAAALATAAMPAQAAAPTGCGEAALGTARTLTLPRAGAAYGTVQHAALPLADDELVLSFDDGPQPGSTERILATLAQHCSRATFFMNGQPMRAQPALARAVRDAGHSLGMHGDTHANFGELTPAAQLADLQAMQHTWRTVLGSEALAWRFPFLAESALMRETLAAQRITVMSIDVGIEDWLPDQTPAMLTERLLRRLDERRQARQGGSIVLLHDGQTQTADALPMMLQALHRAGWRVVHLQWAP